MESTELFAANAHNLLRQECKRMSAYLRESREHRREFEEWYQKKYGKPYIWKKGSEIPNETQPTNPSVTNFNDGFTETARFSLS